MEEQSKTLSSASKPFKSSTPGQPDLVVQQGADEMNSSSSTCAVVAISGDDRQNDAHTKLLERVQSPHAELFYRLGIPVSKVSDKGAKPPKTPMTPRRLLNFVAGLFIAGMFGSFSNGFIIAGIERAFPPQYVKDFYQAQSLPDREEAFSGMHKALTEGQKIEPLSRRFTNLTESLAAALDHKARYLEAKTEWAKAAVPSDAAPPELRERKRSFLVNEAESEHLAVASKLKNDVDQNLLKEVEEAGFVFQKSEVIHHGSRAYRAFLTAGELAADSKDFARARKDFDQAEMIANTQWQDGGLGRQSLAAARWRAELHELIVAFGTSKCKPIPHNQYTPGSLTLEGRQALETDLALHNWDKLDSMFDEAQKNHQQDIQGDTVVSDMYSALGDNIKDYQKNKWRYDNLLQWGQNTRSPRAWLALAYWSNAKAEVTADYFHNNGFPEQAESAGIAQLREALENLNQALTRNPEVANNPSFIKAIQTNLAIGLRLSTCGNPQADLYSDLHSANVAMNGDEFYARAVSRAGATRACQGVDVLRYGKGNSVLAKKFGIPKSQIAPP